MKINQIFFYNRDFPNWRGGAGGPPLGNFSVSAPYVHVLDGAKIPLGIPQT